MRKLLMAVLLAVPVLTGAPSDAAARGGVSFALNFGGYFPPAYVVPPPAYYYPPAYYFPPPWYYGPPAFYAPPVYYGPSFGFVVRNGWGWRRPFFGHPGFRRWR